MVLETTTRSLPPLPPGQTHTTPRHLKRLSLSTASPHSRELLPSPSPTLSRSARHASGPRESSIAPHEYAESTILDTNLPTTAASTVTTESTPSDSATKLTPRHSKRSSISYSSSPSLSRSASLQRIAPTSTPSTPTLDRYPSQSNVNSISNPTTKGNEEDSQGGFLSSNRTAAGIGAQPSLSELNFDLLSFIAKQERKCLDLREELKRNEGELAALKKKWESIVAHSASPPATTRTSTTSTDSRSRIPNPSNNPFDLSKPLPRQRQTDDTADDTYTAAEIEIGESVQAAKKWMGGVFGKVLEAVSGLEEDPNANSNAEGRLLALKEEDEPEESGEAGRKRESESSASSFDGRRTSGTSSRISTDSTSSYNSKTHPSTTPTTSPTIRLSSTSTHHFSSLPSTSSELNASSSTSSFGAYQSPSSNDSEKSPLRSRAEAENGVPRPRNGGAEGGHNRRRSTFDMLGSAAGGGWNSIGKRWAGLTESETFQNSKRATLNLVDSIEKGITTTLGPLDPPSTTPTSSPRLAHTPLPLAAPPRPPATTTKEETTPKASSSESNWDWSTFLERPSSTTSANVEEEDEPTEQRLGGYRRPSLTAAPASTIYPPPLKSGATTRMKNKALPESPERGLSDTGSNTRSLLSNRHGTNTNGKESTKKEEEGGIPSVMEEDEWGW